MCKIAVILSILVAVLITESSCQGFRIIRPTYRPPPRRPVIIRARRDAPNQQPLWLNQGDIPRAPATGDHPFLPKYIDDIKLDPNRRYARCLQCLPPAEKIVSGSDRHTGPTDPEYNHRQAREIRLPFEPLPRPYDPWPRPQRPIDPFNPYPRPGPAPHFPVYV